MSVPIAKLFVNEFANDLQCLFLSYRPVKRSGYPHIQQRLISNVDLGIIKMFQVPEDIAHRFIFMRNIALLPGSYFADINIFFPDQGIYIADLYLLSFLQDSYHFLSPAYLYFTPAYRYYHSSKIRIGFDIKCSPHDGSGNFTGVYDEWHFFGMPDVEPGFSGQINFSFFVGEFIREFQVTVS